MNSAAATVVNRESSVAEPRGPYQRSDDQRPGTFWANRSGDAVEIRWYFQAADESRTFGMEGLFRQLGIFSQVGQLYEPEDAGEFMFYREDEHGQIQETQSISAGLDYPGVGPEHALLAAAGLVMLLALGFRSDRYAWLAISFMACYTVYGVKSP